MSFLRRVANLARGTFKVGVRDWSAPDDEPSQAPTPRATADVPPSAASVVAASVSAASVVAPPAEPARAPPEQDERGDVKRTL